MSATDACIQGTSGMTTDPIDRVTTLTFDVFGTILDLSGSLVPPLSRFLTEKGTSVDGSAFWQLWRARQRIEQYQDTLFMLGHSGYLETCRRTLVYCLLGAGVEFTSAEVDDFMPVYQELRAFDDAVEGLELLGGHYRLVALSNGEQWYLEHLAESQIGVSFDSIISVDEAGVFKPHPAVYRAAARILGLEPKEIMMVASHSFDVMGARACRYRGAFVNRYGLPFEETPYTPDITVPDFRELASELLRTRA